MTDTLPDDPDATPQSEHPSLIAYAVGVENLELVNAPYGRTWMDQTGERFAYRCLPMLMANQSGWFLINRHQIDVVWNGGPSKESILIKYGPDGEGECPATSIFGQGILTWHIPYLFRTPPGYNLLVRGPVNWPKENVYALEGLVEADWAVATFTMNYKIMRPNVVIRFSRGDPVCMVLPQRRNELESFRPVIRSIESDSVLHDSYRRWVASRGEFLKELKNVSGAQPPATAGRWQKHYFRGKAPDGTQTDDHAVKRTLHDFEVKQQDGAAKSAPGDSFPSAPSDIEDRIPPECDAPPQHDLLPTSDAKGRPRITYLICAAPRSGSYLLSEGLERTGLAGRPTEFFHPNPAIEIIIRRQVDAEQDPFKGFVRKVMLARTGPNGVSGCKVHWFQFQYLSQQLGVSLAEDGADALSALGKHFPNLRYIWLRRRDRLRQAISHARAVQSDVWWEIDGATRPPKAPPQFDRDLIDATIRDLEKSDLGWVTFFARCHLSPYVLWYEDFCENYQATIRNVLQYLDIPGADACVITSPRLRKQADLVSEEWVRRYLDSTS